MGNRGIKPCNKTKEEIIERFSLRLITSSHAFEPVLEIETNLAVSGSQSGSVSTVTPGCDFANGKLPYFSKSKSQDQGLSTLM